MLQIDYNKVEIYIVPAGTDRLEVVKKCLIKQNLIFNMEFTFNPKIKLLRSGFIVIGEDRMMKIYRQCDFVKFHKKFEVSLFQKYKAVTVRGVDYSARLGQVLVGTSQGDFYLIDCEANRIIFKCHKYKTPVIECRICEVLKCMFVFWECGKLCFFDLLTFSEIQDFTLFDSTQNHSLRRKTTWAYFPPIDEEMESLSRTTDIYDDETKNKISKALEDRISAGR